MRASTSEYSRMAITRGFVARNNGNLSLRDAPAPDALIVGSLPMGTVLEIHELRNGWYRVDVGQRTGWVSAAFVQLPTVSAVPERSCP